AGHSIGELAAAHIAGVLSLTDACTLVAARSCLMGDLPPGGAMFAIEATEEEMEEALAEHGEEVAIAAINGPSSVVVSGRREAVERVGAQFRERGGKTKRLEVSHAFHSPLMEPMLEEFSAVAGSLSYDEPRIPIVSTTSGQLLESSQATDPAYWVAQVRAPVRFADAIATLDAQGANVYLEVGPDAVLTAMGSSCLAVDDRRPGSSAFVPTLREDRPEVAALVTALARAHASGANVEWRAFFAGSSARRVPLPTYSFQRQRYWLDAAPGAAGITAAGQEPADHPLLGAALPIAGGEELLLTGRLSLQAHPWLADHAVAGTVLLPGTAFVEIALAAAAQVAANGIEELILQAPLVLADAQATQLQVKLGEPDSDGRRDIAIHSRLEASGVAEVAEWACNATGTLSTAPATPGESLDTWPPEGAEPVEPSILYGALAEVGLEYGPAFQAVSAAWRNGDYVYAEVALGDEQASDAARFAVHPALLDAAGHAALGIALASGASGEEQDLQLPFAWRGVRVAQAGTAALRVRVDLESRNLVCFGESGNVVVEAESVVSRPVDADQLRGVLPIDRSLYRVEWPEASLGTRVEREPRIAIIGELEHAPGEADRQESLRTLVAAVEQGATAPEVVVVHLGRSEESKEDVLDAFHASASACLGLLQEWVDAGALAQARLTVLTERAAAVEREDLDVSAGPLWGLVRSAQTEHPDRFALLDVDGKKASWEALATALAAGEKEPQLVIRDGRLLTPRLAHVRAEERPAARPLDPESTVLMTGGAGAVGSLVARHLVSAHGVRHLLLVSRRGEQAERATELADELSAMGAEVTIAACDVADRGQLEALLTRIPDEHPLGAVYHLAGVIDDGTLESLDSQRLQSVFGPKADAAWYLHELTEGFDLAQFMLFSSAGGLIGNPGQANYAAANAFLDSLTAWRRAQGLPGISMAWGAWAIGVELHDELEHADFARLNRLGYVAMSAERALGLYDTILAVDEAQPVPLELDRGALQTMAASGLLPPVLRSLVRVPAAPERARGLLAQTLAELPEAEREAAVVELVRGHTATVLGLSSAEDVDPERAFQELGFDSLAAVELRNQLGAATGLRLPPTLIFDYPSVRSIAIYLLVEIVPGEKPSDDTGLSAADELPELDDERIERIDLMDIEDLVEQTLERQGTDTKEEN
ncbi:MAG TPA: SDR family NAD(P)-dependent oxidoreductase, partial [Solirubrobacterales bacterium]|nr:SDR family NAD(P)-dependent oxidoreductase [Solirubrobacterales bacterium]